jgi:hypothetical protein
LTKFNLQKTSKAGTLLEKWYGAVGSQQEDGLPHDVFVNPTTEEIRECGDKLGFLADDQEHKVYIWNADIISTKNILDMLYSFKPRFVKRCLVWGSSERKGSTLEPLGLVLFHNLDQDTTLNTDWSWSKNYHLDLSSINTKHLVQDKLV